MTSQKFVDDVSKIVDESAFMQKSNREADHLMDAFKDAVSSASTLKEKVDLVADRIQDQEPDLFSLIAVLDAINEENPWHTNDALKIIGNALIRSREPKMYNLLFEGKN